MNVKKLGIKCLILLTLIVTSLQTISFQQMTIPRNSIKYVLNKFLIRIRLAHKLRQNESKITSKR
jgi:hypothetical protein